MTSLLTSVSSPIRIAELSVPGVPGRLGLTICPGKKGPSAADHSWDRDIKVDVEAISKWPARAVLSLLEDFELDLLEVRTLGETVRNSGMEWVHLEIADGEPPDQRFESEWAMAFRKVWALLVAGRNVLIHCRGGLGRTGTVAALILREAGASSDEAIKAVRAARPGAIETADQERYVHHYRPLRLSDS